MARVYNFSAGPSMLPEEVLKKAAAEMLDYEGCGQSVMEMSHRSKTFDKIIKDAEQLFRELMNIPDNYKVLFLQGGASTQFAAIPMNFMNKNKKADFIITGQWAKKAYQEAAKYGAARAVASSADKTFSYIPKTTAADFDKDADYVYICMNNTIYGTKFPELPEVGNIPLIADVSSMFLSEPVDVSKFAVIYGGAQKNIAPAGLTVVIIREDMLGNEMDITPTMLNYKIMAENDSLYNTPPCYTIYMCKLVLEWIKEQGGVEAVYATNVKKADILYNYLDSSSMFSSTVAKEDRSLMNVPFVTGNEELDAKFVKEATAAGFVNLKGHRSVGGMRASIYNAMPVEGVEKLVEFMKEFEKANS
ncbi:MAG: 3-phosphoserine/phosphohydroxythreonine transaminase [Clostridia bacterium]|nr:3-phosphoserine/phosphohydroxythreonine transaminase [Clostridia bacterium]MBR3955341.1 3-phosphoserine/phosphohydroxythreonine transaminase [Clostridia bacterium]